jgi:hypothetical protein
MPLVRISLVTVGHMPRDLHLARVRSWHSSVFQIVGSPESYAVTRDSDGPDWEYTDTALEALLPLKFEGDFLFALVNLPLTDNFYGRRLSGNRAVVSLHEVAEIMRMANIPVENAVLRLLYSAVLTYARFGNELPRTGDNEPYTHDETRGCLFDMNANKLDLVASCDRPSVCPDCVTALRAKTVPLELIANVQRELKRIRKPLYFRLLDWIRSHPLVALLVSAIAALLLGIISSLIASYTYAALTSHPVTSPNTQRTSRAGDITNVAADGRD